MKKIFFWCALTASILAFNACGKGETAADKTAKKGAQTEITKSLSEPTLPKIEGAVASVNGVKISLAEFEERLWRILEYRKASGKRELNPDEMIELRFSILSSLIQRELLYQESINKGVKVTSEEVEIELQREKMQFAEEKHFEEALQHQRITLESLKKDWEKKIAIEKFLNEYVFKDKIKIEEKAMREFYDDLAERFKPQYEGQKPPSYESQKPHIYAILRKQQEERLTEEFLDNIEKNAKIETFLNLE